MFWVACHVHLHVLSFIYDAFVELCFSLYFGLLHVCNGVYFWLLILKMTGKKIWYIHFVWGKIYCFLPPGNTFLSFCNKMRSSSCWYIYIHTHLDNCYDRNTAAGLNVTTAGHSSYRGIEMWNKRLEILFCGLALFHRSWLWKFDPGFINSFTFPHVFAIFFSFLCTECFSSAKEFHILLQRCAQDVSWIPPSICAFRLTRHIFVKLHKC